MKIAIIIKDFTKDKGGGELSAYYLAKELSKNNHTVSVISNNFSENIQFKIEKIKIKNSLFKFSRSYEFAKKSEKYIKNLRHNNYIIYGLTQAFNCDFIRLGGGVIKFWEKIKYQKNKLKKYLSLNHYLNKYIEKKMLYSKYLKKIIVNSNLCKNQLIEYYNFDSDFIELVRNGTDINYFSLEETLTTYKSLDNYENLIKKISNRYTLFFAANNFERKGLYNILQFIEFQKDKPFLIIAGKGNINKLKKYIKEKNLEDFTHIAGFKKDLRPYFLFSDLFILPTYYDPFANVCLEAGVFGIPIATTKNNGFSEIIKQKETGYVLENPDDFEGIKNAISTFKKREKFNKIYPDIRNHYSQYTLEKYAENTIKVLEQ